MLHAVLTASARSRLATTMAST
eukprot:COSAG01_NODE_64194_length_277_cov_0.876404_1_plen_21_part_10